MKIIESIEEMREYSRQLKRDGKTIASVATTGYLHDGHMSLVKIAKENADVVVMNTNAMSDRLTLSIEWPKNYKKYLIEAEAKYQQQSLENDLEVCRKHKVDIFFHPSMLDYYSYPIQTITISHAINKRLLNSPDISRSLTGSIISWCIDLDAKIWNSILPDIIVEGQKDIHQTIFMKFFLNYFHYPIKIIIAPTLRDSDGVAFSSRNRLLSKSERQNATSVYQSLQEVSAWTAYPSIEHVKMYINEYITRNNGSVYYTEICCAKTLEELNSIDKETVIVVAARFGEVDIWDNIIIKPNHNKTKMKIIESIDEMREYSQQCKRDGKTVGLIDTEGSLHDGHMSLVKVAKENVDVAIVSICHTAGYFDFSTEEYKTSLKKYKADVIEDEIEICKLNNVDVLFFPPMDDLYSDTSPLNISIPTIDKLIIDRPEPFHPVNMKFILGARELYNIILPDVSVLGQKDVEQVFVLKSLIKQLDLPIEVITAPIFRDSDGLASSSRNIQLTRSERERAVSIYKTLHEVSTWPNIESVEYIKEYITSHIQSKWCFVNICCAETLEELHTIDRDAIILVMAGPFGRKGVPLHELVTGDGFNGTLTDNIFVYQ